MTDLVRRRTASPGGISSPASPPWGLLASSDSAGTTFSGKQPNTALPALRRHWGSSARRMWRGHPGHETDAGAQVWDDGSTAPGARSALTRSRASSSDPPRVAVHLESFGLQGQLRSPARAHRRRLSRTIFQFDLLYSTSLPSVVVFGVFCCCF